MRDGRTSSPNLLVSNRGWGRSKLFARLKANVDRSA